jgi:hypothetical protein
MTNRLEHIQSGLHDEDAWVCICGNEPHTDGFYPCDENGNEVEPNLDWEDLYTCGSCGRIINRCTLEVVGQKQQPRKHHIICCPSSDLMTNLSEYDALEVSGVRNLNEDTDDETCCEPCADHEAEFWSVYAHYVDGGVMCIGDFETSALANAYADALSGKLNLPVTYR